MKKFNLNNPITSVNDIRSFVEYIINTEQVSFHPDTPFNDYINLETKERTYTDEEAELRDSKLQECFEFGEMNGFDAHEMISSYGLSLVQGMFA